MHAKPVVRAIGQLPDKRDFHALMMSRLLYVLTNDPLLSSPSTLNI